MKREPLPLPGDRAELIAKFQSLRDALLSGSVPEGVKQQAPDLLGRSAGQGDARAEGAWSNRSLAATFPRFEAVLRRLRESSTGEQLLALGISSGCADDPGLLRR